MNLDLYQSITNRAGLFDRSDLAKLELTGPDAPMFLGNLSTNDIQNIPLGGGCESYFCNANGKALFQTRIYHLRLGDGRHALWIETVAGRRQALVQHLDRHLISEAVEIEDVSDRFAQWHLAGPNARAILEAVVGGSVPDLQEFQHMERALTNGQTCSIRRTDPLAMPGYDVVCLKEKSNSVRDAIVAAGAILGDAEIWNTLRIEAGTPEFGVDIDENRFVMEIGNVARAVSYSKGCYLGQEPIVMSRDRAGHAPRSFVSIKLESQEPIPAGAKVFIEAEEVGTVTSSTLSPKFGSTLALGYVRWKHREPGTTVTVDKSKTPGVIVLANGAT